MKRILVIEDSKTLNNIIAKELRTYGYEVHQAFTFEEAEKKLKKILFDLLVLDLHLPDGEGSELIAHIQSLTKTKVVVLTSSQDENLREELFGYGILDYIIKDANLVYSIKEIVKIVSHLEVAQQKKVLIIDDSNFVIKQIKTILEPRNFNLSAAKDGKKGLKELFSHSFDLLILDMELPDVHGLELLHIIRKENRFKDLPIIVLSGNYTAQVVRDALKNGANDFLKKPFIYEEFILKIDLWIDYFAKEKELKEKTQELAYINKNLEQLVAEKIEQNRQKEEIMLQQSRHAQMGEMIAMIAHQWRQPLNIIGISSSVLQQKIKDKQCDMDVMGNVVNKIMNYVDYLSHTIDDFRNFFQPRNKQSVTDFEKITQKALDLIHHSLESKGIMLQMQLKNTTPFIAYENELVQVVLNLIRNSEDALMQSEVNDKKITITIDSKEFIIQDNAGGIPQEIIEKIFDPYFTTKKSKEGSGLGLYMSKIILKEHCHGDIFVKNTKEGAEFTIKIFED